jgi:CheY-like chemotaxis protein
VRGGVTFHFEIPEASSAELLKVEKQETEADVEAALRTAAALWNGHMNVLILDDEKLYRDAILMLLSDEFCSAKLRIHTATNAQEALDVVALQRINLAFLDIDLGRDAATGLDVLAKMRASGERAFCCVHSNRVLDTQADFEQKHGADAVVPKPITRIQLMRILIKAGSRLAENATRGVENDLSNKRYAFVDDCEGTRVIWESDWPEGKLMTFASPEEFWKHSEINPEFLSGLSAVFTDFRFDDASATSGSDFATSLKNRFSGPVFLTTDAVLTLEREHDSSENRPYKVLSKSAPSREFLRGLSH